MGKYIGVKFRTQGQIYYFDSSPYVLNKGEHVVVSTDEGLGIATVKVVREDPPQDLSESQIKPIVRVATEEDHRIQQENEKLGNDAFQLCLEKIKEFGLEMKLVDVDVRFDQSKLIFYFTAPSRVDFRDLVKVLVEKYRTRIELRQIGVRHEAQILGGIGNCGRVCCCHQFLRKFEPVTIKMAKEQQLFLNPSKISGVCGRLLCCLNFEKQNYAEFYQRCPKIGKKFDTQVGEVKILRANFFHDSLIIGNTKGDEREVTLVEWAELLESTEEIDTYDFWSKSRSNVFSSGPSLEELEQYADEDPSVVPAPDNNKNGNNNKNNKPKGNNQKNKNPGKKTDNKKPKNRN